MHPTHSECTPGAPVGPCTHAPPSYRGGARGCMARHPANRGPCTRSIAVVNFTCPDCGEVDHQPIVDDEAHCGCGGRSGCPCACHGDMPAESTEKSRVATITCDDPDSPLFSRTGPELIFTPGDFLSWRFRSVGSYARRMRRRRAIGRHPSAIGRRASDGRTKALVKVHSGTPLLMTRLQVFPPLSPKSPRCIAMHWGR